MKLLIVQVSPVSFHLDDLYVDNTKIDLHLFVRTI
jgi:hypothetical protein